MEETNISVKDLLPFVGVIIGGLITLATTYWLETRKQVTESKRLALAFRGEIGALLEIIKKRKYLEGFQNAITQMETTGERQLINIQVRREYFPVFKSNVGNIGLLPCSISELVAKFYIEANALLEDIESHRDGTFDDVDVLYLIAGVKEMHALLQDIIKNGEQIIKNTNLLYPQFIAR